MCKHIMPLRLGCPLWTKNVQGKNTNTEEDNNDNGAEQPLTIEERLERTPVKTCYENPLGKKKQEIWIGTMAHAPAIGSRSYGGFTEGKRTPVKTCYKNPLGKKKQEIWVGTMAHARATLPLIYPFLSTQHAPAWSPGRVFPVPAK